MVFSGRGALAWKAVSPTGLGKLILISEIAAGGQPKASLSDFTRRDSPAVQRKHSAGGAK